MKFAPLKPESTLSFYHMSVHVGQFVKSLIEQKQLKLNVLKPVLNKSQPTVSRMLAEPDWLASDMLKVSKHFNINLFSLYDKELAEFAQVSEPTAEYQRLSSVTEVDKLRVELKQCNDSNEVLRELVSVQRDRIKDLEKR